MEKSPKQLILQSFYHLLGGIIRLALRNGVSYKDFIAIGKHLYVDIASKEYGLQGRPTNMARIALMTGIDRKEVKRLLEQTIEQYHQEAAPHRLSKILSVWHQDKLYLDKKGQPREIPIEGPAPSFEHLVKSYGGDIAVVTVLREFKRSQTVLEDQLGKVKALKPYYVPNYLDDDTNHAPDLVKPEAIAQGSSMLVDHINTIFHNLYRKDAQLPEKLDLRATNFYVSKDCVSSFYKLINKEGMKLLQDSDEWLSEHEVSSSEETERLGVGIYFIQGENESANIEKRHHENNGDKLKQCT